MPPPEALVDELCCRLPTYLREQLNITDVTAAAGAGCEAAALEDWARRTGYALPDDLRAFLLVADGIKCDWAVDVKTRGPAAVGALRVHALADMVPVPLDGGDDDAFRRDEGTGRVERAFELDRSARVGRVARRRPCAFDAPARIRAARGPRRLRRSASPSAVNATRPRSGSRTSPAAGTTWRPRSRAPRRPWNRRRALMSRRAGATSASPSPTSASGAGRAATRPAARTRSRASGCASTAPSGSTRVTARPPPRPPRPAGGGVNHVGISDAPRVATVTWAGGIWVVWMPPVLGVATVSDSSKLGVCGTPRGRREGKGGGSRALRRCSGEGGREASTPSCRAASS